MTDTSPPTSQCLSPQSPQLIKEIIKILLVFGYLGVISFGGPTAHLGFFQRELIERRQWLTTNQFVQLVALCQIIPGPTSSQVGMALGYFRGGFAGSFAAWLGFTLPSAIMLTVFALWATSINTAYGGLIHGLKLAACAVVLLAVIQMAQNMCSTKRHGLIAIVIAGCAAFTPLGQWHIVLILLAAGVGLAAFRQQSFELPQMTVAYSMTFATLCLLIFLSVLGLVSFLSIHGVAGFLGVFYRASSLVFGGGHVVLPLLQQDMTHYHVDADQFLMGYGFIQALPGPLFNIAAYLGASAYPEHPIVMAAASVMAIFLPAALVLYAILGLNQHMSRFKGLTAALQGIHAAVVGILAAALVPMYSNSILQWQDIIVLSIAFVMLYKKWLPVSVVVLLCAGWGLLYSAI